MLARERPCWHPQQTEHTLTSLVNRSGPFILAQMAPWSRPLKTTAYLEHASVCVWLYSVHVCLRGAHPCTWVHSASMSLHVW